MKKSSFMLLIFIFTATHTCAQKLHLNEIINAVYVKSQLNTDTLYYITSYNLTFITADSSINNSQIHIKTFNNKEALIHQLSDKKSLLLEVTITDVGMGRLKIKLGIHQTNKKSYTGQYQLLAFYDERVIECVYNPVTALWAYDKTISQKKHITD
jgi:hypothetical protein